jgi:putative ABC transport system permease protein
MLDDLRAAWRGLTGAKGLMVMLLASLALGIAANLAVGRAIYILLWQPPAGVADPASLVSIYTSQSGGDRHGPSSYASYLRLRSQLRTLSAVIAIDDRTIDNVGIDVGIDDGIKGGISGEIDGASERTLASQQGLPSQQMRVARVSEDFFSGLGMSPHLGRLLQVGDAERQPRPAVIGFERWQALGSPADILDRPLIVGSNRYRIVGVAPRGFRGLQAGRSTGVWIPLGVPDGGAQRDRVLTLFGRLAPGSSLDDAANEVRAHFRDNVSAALPGAAEAPAEANADASLDPAGGGRAAAGYVPTVLPYSRLDPATRRQQMIAGAVIAATMGLLLLSACVNAINLLLARAVARRGVAAVMLALGAPRRRLVRQALMEHVLLVAAAAVIALPLASWMARLIPLLFAADHAELIDTPFDRTLAAGTLVAAAVLGVLIGLVPAMQGTAVPADATLRGESGVIAGPRGHRLRTLVVICQIALSIVLLVMTVFLRNNLDRALRTDLGFFSRDVAILTIDSPGSAADPSRIIAFQEKAHRALIQTARIRSAGWASTLPLGANPRRQFWIETDASESLEAAEFDFNVVSPSYFTAMRLPLIEGRLFDGRNLANVNAGVTAGGVSEIVVDEVLASRWLNGRARGRTLRDAAGTRYTIVGVVASGRYRTLQEAPRPTVYLPHTGEAVDRAYLVVSTRGGNPSAMLPTITSTLAAIDPAASVVQASTLDDHLARALTVDRMTTTLVGLCGIIALALATLGVYGMISEAVQRRTREIGLRVALGADARSIASLVFLEAFTPVAAGLALGFYVLFMTGRVARSLIYGVPVLDAITMLSVSAVLVAVVALAAAPPLRRALRVSPSLALRVT